MSGKFQKKKKKNLKVLWFVLALAVLLLVSVLVPAISEKNSDATETKVMDIAETTASTVAVAAKTSFVLDENLEIVKLGNYTGAYMEDGSDEIVSGIMMIIVTNNGKDTLQYAEITLSGEAGDAVFKLSTLKPGEKAVVLEANRKTYSSTDSYSSASAENVVYFTEPVSLQEDKLKIQPLDGGFNITNISEQDINGKITIYFKDSADGMYYGGITYRGTIEGGMKAGEIKQVMSENFSASGSTVVFITIMGE